MKKKGYYRFFSQAQPTHHEETVVQPNISTTGSKRYNHRRDGIETETDSEAPRLTRYEKDRLKLGNKKIVAIGYVGMCDRGVDMVNHILGKTIFEPHVQNTEKWDIGSFPIDSYHDTESGTVHLYLSTTLHLANALSVYAQREDDSFKNDFGVQLEDREYQMIKSLLFMFHTCHIINFITAERRFDLRIPKLLRMLQLTKQNQTTQLLNHLSTHPLSASLKFNSLYSVGRVLPVFSIIWVGNGNNNDKITSNLENQVRAILKRGKLSGTDNIRTPLLMIDPTRCAFVLELDSTNENDNIQLTKFKEHLERQFDYFTRQMQTGKRYVLPTSFNWYHACFALEAFDFNDDKIKNLINPDWQFSENRCTQAFQLVKDQFAQTQNQYGNASELTSAATLMFDAYACGPYQEIYRKKLVDEFKNVKITTTSEEPSTKLVGDHYPFIPTSLTMPVSEYVIQTTTIEPSTITRENGSLPYVDVLVDDFTSDLTGITKLLHDVSAFSEGKSKKTVKKRIYIGFEFETNGKKYFLTNEMLSNLKKKEEKVSLLTSDIPLTLPSQLFTREKASTAAKMTSIIVHTPAADVTVIFSPKIETEEVYTGMSVVLARGCTSTIGINTRSDKGKLVSAFVINNGVINK